MKKLLFAIAMITLVGCDINEVTVPIYTHSSEKIFQTLDTFYIDHIMSDTVYGKMPYYGTEELNDSIRIRFYGRMIGTVKIKRKYLTP